jgi:nucleoside-diphosphate-sugar epimerase
MLILVTGGNGFVGSHLVEGLLAQGHQVRCLLRPTSDLSFIASLPLEHVWGALDDVESLERACRGVDAVYHLAGATKAPDAATYFRVNEQGTRSLLEACWRVNPGVRRFVYCSSLAAAGPADSSTPIDETCPPHPVSHYGRSKLAGEEAVRAYAGRLPVVILRPAPVYGPRERDILTYFRLVQRGLKLLPGRGAHQVCMIHVSDLVRLALRVLEDERVVGQTYFACDGEAHDLEAVLDAVGAALGKRTLRVVIPIPLLEVFAALGGIWARLSKRPVLLNDQKLQEMKQRYWLCDVSKARRELGFVPQVDLQTGMALTARWYREQGWLSG